MTIGRANPTQLIHRFAEGCHGQEYSDSELGAEKDVTTLMHGLGGKRARNSTAVAMRLCEPTQARPSLGVVG